MIYELRLKIIAILFINFNTFFILFDYFLPDSMFGGCGEFAIFYLFYVPSVVMDYTYSLKYQLLMLESE